MGDSASSGFKWVGSRPVRPDGLDKVTGRANFGADFTMPGMLVGRILRSPHAHARVAAIDASAALDVPGVRAVVTADDFPDIPDGDLMVGEGPMNFRDLSHNVMARGKALYDGHPGSAVAAREARALPGGGRARAGRMARAKTLAGAARALPGGSRRPPSRRPSARLR